MKTIQTYTKSEDAYFMASLLGSHGIDSVVLDENGFGGNFLGGQKNAIRLQVSEEDQEEALEIVAANGAKSASSETEPIHGVQVDWAKANWFDWVVIAEISSLIIFAAFPDVFYPDPGVKFFEYLNSFVLLDGLWMIAYEVYPGYIILSCIASLLLLKRLIIGKYLYTGILAYGLSTCLFYPAAVLSPIGGFFNAISWMLSGAIFLSIWTAPLSQEFRKR